MNRQMTLAEMNDEFGAARTNKKDFLNKMDSIIPWDICKRNRAALLQRRARQQTIITGIDAENIYAPESI